MMQSAAPSPAQAAAGPGQHPIPTPRLPQAEQFFMGALTSHSLAHGYILKGKSYGASYLLALQIAQILNCKNRPARTTAPSQLQELACGHCTDCRWIAKNAHPAVQTVSRMTFQVNSKASEHPPALVGGDELEKIAAKSSWPTKILTGQVSRLIFQLSLSSEYHRVVIFTDSEELPGTVPTPVPPPCEWASLEATQGRTFHIRPLERHTFNRESVNRFLKTLEEPLPRTLFFFIAETEEQILDTVTSRCQVIPCHSGLPAEPPPITPDSTLFLEGWVNRLQHQGDLYACAAEFQTFCTDQAGLSLSQGLQRLQQYLRQRYQHRILDHEDTLRAYRDAHTAIESTLAMLQAKSHENASLIHLLTQLPGALGRLSL